jgi:hypothetical protein
MTSPPTLALLAALVLPGLALAQAPLQGPEEFQPLSMLPVPAPKGEVPELPPGAAGPALSASPVEEPGRPFRIGMSLLFGAASGAALGLAGGAVGAAAIPADSVRPLSHTWLGAGLGFAIGAPLGVLLSGWLFDGDGAWWAAVLGDLAGLAAGAAATLLGGPQGTPLMFALPLGGSVLGYEFSSHASRTAVVPVVSLGPGGGSLGLAGGF